MAGCAAFVLLHVLRADLDPIYAPLSFYALGPHAWLFVVGAIAVGVAAITLADLSRLFALAGAALFVIAAVPTDPWLPWQHGPTPLGAVHDAGFFVLVAAFSIGALAVSRTAPRAAGLLLGLAIAFVVCLVGSTMAMMTLVAAGHPPGWLGMAERVLLVFAALWLAVAIPALKRGLGDGAS